VASFCLINYLGEQAMILNLTQRKTTQKQIKAGVVDLADADRSTFCALLTFDKTPSPAEIDSRTAAVALIACYVINHAFEGEKPSQVLIDGPSWLIPSLVRDLKRGGMEPVFAFSTQKKGKKAKHAGLIPAA
jgi:hypothetical protein